MMRKRVAIIGAGPCGLFQLIALKNDDLDLICFERQSDWGGMWFYTKESKTVTIEEPIHTSMYKQ